MIAIHRPGLKTLSIGLLLAGLSAASLAQTLPSAAEVKTYADKLLDAQKIEGPGVAVLVARDKEVLYRSARGMASIELGVPLSADHVFRIGSVTKQFAAAALLKLVDEGRAKLDAPLSKYLPSYPQGDKITLLQLLNHTSGVMSYTSIPGYMDQPIRRTLTTAQLIDEFKNQPVDFKPGEGWNYNNSGYVLVGAVIEAISGKPWHAYVQEALLKPAKLARTQYPGEDLLIKGMVTGYGFGPEGLGVADYLSMTQPHAAGALVSTVDDLWQWNQALHGGQLISPASYKRMVTPEGKATASNYGFGIFAQTLRGQTLYQHGGGINGFVSALHYLPQTKTTVVLLRNAMGPGVDMEAVAQKLGAFAIGKPIVDPKPVPVAVEQLKALEGVYAKDEQNSRTLSVVEGKLVSTRSGGRPFPLIPVGKDEFAFDGSMARIVMERDAKGGLSGLKFWPNGEGTPEVWKRVGDLPRFSFIELTDAQKDALLGEYVSPQIQIKVFKDAQGVLRGQAAGQPPFELKATAPDQLRVVEVDALLGFVMVDGRATEMQFSQGPAKLSLKRR